MKPLTLVVDNLAAKTPVADRLREEGIRIVESFLKNGQYRITDRCTIWHVSADEFSGLAADKKIFRRILDLKHTVPEPIIIIEGDLKTASPHVSPPAMRGVQAFVAMHNRIPILTAENTDEVAQLILMMANQAQNGMGLSVSDHPDTETARGDDVPPTPKGGNGGPPKEPAQLREYIMEVVPEVNPAVARAMLKKFGSLRAVFSASAKDLMAFNGIGPKKAKRIAGFFAGNIH